MKHIELQCNAFSLKWRERKAANICYGKRINGLKVRKENEDNNKNPFFFSQSLREPRKNMHEEHAHIFRYVKLLC